MPKTVAPFDNISDWNVISKYMYPYPRIVPAPGDKTTSDGSISFASNVKHLPSDSGSMDISYNFKGGSHVYDLNVYPNDPSKYSLPLIDGTLSPKAIGMWVKGNKNLVGSPSTGLSAGALTLTLGFYQANNMPINMYPAAVSSDGWTYVVGQLLAGLQFPLRLNYIGLVVIKPQTDMTGDVYISDIQALYSPRTPKSPKYIPIPDNPSWLQFKNSPSDFSKPGFTFAAFDDAHLVASEPSSTNSAVMHPIQQQISGMPNSYKPSFLTPLGDMIDSSTTSNYDYLQSIYKSFGLPIHPVVGNHEITQGAVPENTLYTKYFGPTHYTYTVGNARFIVLDNAHGGILNSDPYQNPKDEEQYKWLVSVLNQNTSKDTFFIVHMPAYDPHVIKNSQMKDRYEAQMYEQLAIKYQNSHKGTHVVMMYGHARGFNENLLDAKGNNVQGGMPNFVIADAGAPPYATTNQGGFYNYALFHVAPNGDVQFVVQPVLSKIQISAPTSTIKASQSEQLSATGTSVTGDDAKALQVPIQNPASHEWVSSNPKVVSVDLDTGKITGRQPGTATITCESGGVSSQVIINVTK